MPRKNRFAPPGYWLHITQRGNDRQRVFLSDADRQYFLDLLAARSQERAVRVAAYTLMSNHFHLVAIGDQADAVSLFMMDFSGLYATYRNAVHRHRRKNLATAGVVLHEPGGNVKSIRWEEFGGG